MAPGVIFKGDTIFKECDYSLLACSSKAICTLSKENNMAIRRPDAVPTA
jgi:hypothetical protein